MHARRLPVAQPDWDALDAVRKIRNAGRQWMTEHIDELSANEQIVWFSEAPRCLWVWEDEDEIVGYAYISQRGDDHQLWISLAVHPDHQGKGIGTRIYRHFVPLVYAEIWRHNTASRKAAEKAGYRVLSENDTKVVMGP